LLPLDKEIKKFIKELTIGNERLKRISKKLNLPYWWVESVVVEYFACRRFAYNGKLYQFDFNLFDDDLVDTIGELKVVIPHYILYQNISPKDLSYRTPRMIVGEYVEPLDKANLIPEGIVNSSAFPFVPNLLGTVDPKMEFSWYAIVYDNQDFYQYKIAELYEINKKQTWFKSSLFDLVPLYEATEKLRILGNEIKNSDVRIRIIKKIEKLYNTLEEIRKPIRNKILDYHKNQKVNVPAVEGALPPPPLLTHIDSLKQTNRGYEIESHIESLMYDAAIENYKNTIKSRKDRKNSSLYHDSYVNEIKYSILCVICCITCLESYINYIFKKYLPDEYPTFERTSTPRQKWLYVPLALNLGFKFELMKDPFKTFSDMVNWRNDAIHNTPQFTKIQILKTKELKGYVSSTYRTFNKENSKRAIECTKEMILKLNCGNKIPVPKWISKTRISDST
jgi:hypothetical protein